MNTKTIKHLMKVVVAILAAGLCSCAITDPMYSANVGRIQDIDYPPNIIVGTWATMLMAVITTNNAPSEDKSYYDIKPNGRGHVRQVAANPSSGVSISIEADFSWKYLGANRWVVTLPPLSEYHVIASNNIRLGSRPAVSMTVRYLDGNLYEVAVSAGAVEAARKVWVPADAQHVGAMARRLRSQPTLNIDDQQ